MPTTAPRCRRTSRRDLTHRHHIGILNDAVVDTLDDGQHRVCARVTDDMDKMLTEYQQVVRSD